MQYAAVYVLYSAAIDRTRPDVNVRAEYRGAPLPGGCQPHAASARVTAGQRGLARPGDGAVSCEAAVKLYVLLDTLCNAHTCPPCLLCSFLNAMRCERGRVVCCLCDCDAVLLERVKVDVASTAWSFNLTAERATV